MEKICRVIELSGDRVLLEAVRQEACVGCSAPCSGKGKCISFYVKNTLGAKVGDRVVVKDGSGKLLPLCALLFLLPCVLGVIALFVASLFLGEGASALLGSGVFCLSFCGAVIFLRTKKWNLIEMDRVEDN